MHGGRTNRVISRQGSPLIYWATEFSILAVGGLLCGMGVYQSRDKPDGDDPLTDRRVRPWGSRLPCALRRRGSARQGCLLRPGIIRTFGGSDEACFGHAPALLCDPLLTPEDSAFLVELMNEPAYIANIGDRGVRTVADAMRYIEEKYLMSYQRHRIPDCIW